jgi:hypothetical protein
MMEHRVPGWKVLGVMGVVLAGLTACDPVPRRTLSAEEKAADMAWVYSQFGENYAPLELKQKLYGFDYEELKVRYLEAAKATKTNDEFYRLMMKFVAEFKDAHTSAALTNASLPNRAQTAFLGFSGIRHGEVLLEDGCGADRHARKQGVRGDPPLGDEGSRAVPGRAGEGHRGCQKG